MAYELILCASWPAQFDCVFSFAGPEWVLFFNRPLWFLLECIISTFSFLYFHVILPKRPDLGNTSTNSLLICWWFWCSLSMAASPFKPTGIRFPNILHLLPYTTTNITPFYCLITPFFWYIIENLCYIAAICYIAACYIVDLRYIAGQKAIYKHWYTACYVAVFLAIYYAI